MVRLTSAASDEFHASVSWYERRAPGLGAQFYDATVHAIHFIEDAPLSGAPVPGEDHTRRLLLTRFPYQIVYRFRQDEIIIVAIAHLRRLPGYWKHPE